MPSGSPFGGERPCHAEQAGFGGAIGDRRGDADLGGQRTKIEDRAALSRLAHQPGRRLGAEEGALEIGVEQAIPQRLINFSDRFACSIPALLMRMSIPPMVSVIVAKAAPMLATSETSSRCTKAFLPSARMASAVSSRVFGSRPASTGSRLCERDPQELGRCRVMHR